jgi:hypothetical protein
MNEKILAQRAERQNGLVFITKNVTDFIIQAALERVVFFLDSLVLFSSRRKNGNRSNQGRFCVLAQNDKIYDNFKI